MWNSLNSTIMLWLCCDKRFLKQKTEVGEKMEPIIFNKIIKEIKPVNGKGNHSWIFIGRADAEAEAPILWPPDVKNGLLGKDPDAEKDWRQEEKGTTEDEMVGWHHWLNGYDFEQAPEDGEGQGSLACCSPWRHKELDTTEWLNWISPIIFFGKE